jgi:hypothetical protein
MTTLIDITQKLVASKSAAAYPFFTRKDPTLCVAGLDSGWPSDYLDNILARLFHQPPVVKAIAAQEASDAGFAAVLDNLSSKVKADVGNPVKLLNLDSALLSTANAHLTEYRDDSAKSRVVPSKTTGFQLWDGNPFVPIFLEYELIYYHIPWSEWDISLRPSPGGHSYKQLRYGSSKNFESSVNQSDWRTAAGQVLVLPQPVFSLEATLDAVLDSAGSIPISDAEVAKLRDPITGIKNLKFVSAPLSSLTNRLLTRTDGSHVVPNVRTQGNDTKPHKPAVDAARVAVIPPRSTAAQVLLSAKDVRDALKTIDAQSALTPYGNLIDFAAKDVSHVPFKPVTHGQMMFTKINIVDIFGQAICLPDPLPRKVVSPAPPPSAYPCISDYLMPEKRGDGVLNTVYHPSLPDLGNYKPEWPLCQFTQLTPSINQDARINAAFVSPTFAGPGTTTVTG